MSKNMLFLAWFVAGICPAVLAAQSYKSLNDKVQLQMEHTTAAAVVRALQQQTKYTFIYDPEYLQHCKVSAPHFNSHSIADVLRYLDENEPIDIEMTNGSTIALRRGRQESVAAKDGKITGKIVDNKNEPLPGVTILVDGGRGVISQADGTYELNLPPGNYTITYSFLSYETKRVTDVVVREDANTPLNVLLRNSGSRLKEVTVTASYRKASVEGLYAMQKNNAAMTDGISAAQIARTPDKNLGEVMKRVSGVSTMDNKYVVVRGLSERYNQAVLNGQVMPSTELNRKNFSFNILPTNIVENVQVVKTLTPDHSAEFGGGSVEVTTLDIPSSDFLYVQAGTSYNDNTTGKDFYSVGLDNQSYLALPGKSRYFMGSLDYKSNKEMFQRFDASGKNVSAVNNNWGIAAMKAPVSQNYQLSAGHVFKQGSRQMGIMASAGYRNNFATQDIVMAQNGYSLGGVDASQGVLFNGKRYGFNTDLGATLGLGYRSAGMRMSLQTLYLRNLDQPFIFGGGGAVNNTRVNSRGYYDITTQTNLWQSQLKAEWALDKRGAKLNAMVSYLRLDKLRPDNHISLNDYLQPDSTAPYNYNIDAGNAPYLAMGSLRQWNRALERNTSWELSYATPFKFNIGNLPLENSLKVGYWGAYKDRSFYVVRSYSQFNNNGIFVPISQAFSADYDLKFDFDRQYGDNFRAAIGQHAGYVMLDNKIGKFRLIWGVRGEYYDLNKIGSALDSAKQALIAANGGKDDLDFSAIQHIEKPFRLFPSANLVYALTPSMNLRAAYAKSIIRPDLRELSVFREYDFELGGVYLGDYVRSTLISHYDLRYEWYPNPGEILSLSGFYKDLKYPMEIYQDGTSELYSLRNNKQAKNYGVEVEMRKSFAFTKVPVLEHLTLYGNFTYLDARVVPLVKYGFKADSLNPRKIVVEEITGKEEKRPQTGASNYLVNAGTNFDWSPVNVTVNYNYTSNRTFRAAIPYQLSIFERPLTSLDAQVAVLLLHRKMEIKVNVANLLNSYSIIYRNNYNDNGDTQNGKRDPTTKELLYQKGQDYIVYKASPGKTYSATISYRF
ncbi:TonB-dependent receptor [Chitinophaga parva]|uniref:TonB-dependent receptor n=1 Tax=Chitinophaga parva TaxID=2169414 RepID=A0A2T7BFW9_9BACT|nr:TonB-dependent receptor [Chitinophaga parva]PUZ25175.1 TonB-dependent receptor [Chitinophaga parva]